MDGSDVYLGRVYLSICIRILAVILFHESIRLKLNIFKVKQVVTPTLFILYSYIRFQDQIK